MFCSELSLLRHGNETLALSSFYRVFLEATSWRGTLTHSGSQECCINNWFGNKQNAVKKFYTCALGDAVVHAVVKYELLIS